MRVIVVGAGLCGLGTAIALDRVGIDAVVLERRPDVTAEGAAITVWNNGLQALARLRLRTDAASIMEPIQVLNLITWKGKRVGAVPVARFANQFGAGAAMVYRPELAALLAENLRPGQIEFRAEVVSIESTADAVTAVLADGRRVEGDLLIGADGIHALTRKLFAPAELVYCGHAAWRGTTTFEHPFFPPGQSFSVLGTGAYFVAHHLPDGRFYWIGTRATASPQRVPRAQWKSAAREWFGRWIEPVRALIDATPESGLLLNDIYSCRTANFAVGPRHVLLGDAAHASAPQLGQGACIAFEDAVVLADCLRQEPWTRAGHRFVRLRQDRAQRIVTKSQAVADLYHRKAPASAWLRNLSLRLAPASFRLNKAGWASRITLPSLPESRVEA